MIKRRAAEQKGGKVLPYSSRSPRCNDSHEPKRLQQPETRRSAWVTIQPWLHHVLVASTTWLPLPWVAIPHRVLSEIPRPRIDFGGLATVPTKSPSAAARWSRLCSAAGVQREARDAQPWCADANGTHGAAGVIQQRWECRCEAEANYHVQLTVVVNVHVHLKWGIDGRVLQKHSSMKMVWLTQRCSSPTNL